MNFIPTQRLLKETPRILTAFFKEAPLEGDAAQARIPHGETHNQRIIDTLKQANPESNFISVKLEAGTILEGQDTAYSIEGAMPFSPLDTPLETLPKNVQQDITDAKKKLAALPQTIQILQTFQAVANKDKTVFYIDPTKFLIYQQPRATAPISKSISFPSSPY